MTAGNASRRVDGRPRRIENSLQCGLLAGLVWGGIARGGDGRGESGRAGWYLNMMRGASSISGSFHFFRDAEEAKSTLLVKMGTGRVGDRLQNLKGLHLKHWTL